MDYGRDARLRIVAETLGRVLDGCATPDFHPSDLEEPINRLIPLFPSGVQALVHGKATAFLRRAAETGNPAEAAEGMITFLDQCFVEDTNPLRLRPAFDRILGAYRSSPVLYEKLAGAITALASRVDGLDVLAQKQEQETRAKLRSLVEDEFIRSQRAAVLVEKLHREAQSGDAKRDAMSIAGVTWYEPASGRQVRRTLVLDKAVGPTIARTVVQLRRRFAYLDLGIRAPGRVLMDGPPGTGKTMVARYIAHLLNKPCAVMRLDEIVGKLIGDTAKNVTAVLEAAIARKAVLFLDEVDGLFPPRDGDLTGSGGEELRRITSAFLQQVTMLPPGQIVLCATNRPEALDSAFLRRFPDRISFTYPDIDTRREIARRTWKKLVFTPDAHEALVARTEGTSGDHVTVVAMAAARIAADILLDDAAVMEDVGTVARKRAEALYAEAEAQDRAEREANPGNLVADMPDNASDAEIDAAREALEADRTTALAKAKAAALKAATRKSRTQVLRERVKIDRAAVDIALRDNPPPPQYLARRANGQTIPMPEAAPARLTSSLIHLPG